MEQEFKTTSDIELARVYGPDNADVRDPGAPGAYPYTRGVHDTMYRGRLWTMRQYAGFGTAVEANQRYRWLLDRGQTGLSVAFDLPTQIGLDADDPAALGEVGRVGVHIGTIDDMDQLFDSIPLDEVSTSLTINATASILLAFYVAVAKRRGIDPAKLRGTLQNDVLKEYIARGTWAFPPEPSLRIIADLIEYTSTHIPKWNPISISGYHIREAGSTAVQEIAFTFANAEVYVKEVLARGLDIDAFAPKLAFFFACHNHFLEEIAKFRAARRLWARVMKEDFGAKDPKSHLLRFHVQTGGSTLTSQQPEVNVVRVALQAMAATLGGCQSLHTNSYDEALALPTEESVEVALRTQQILAYETGIADTVDPVAGSWAVETLTSQLEDKAYAELKAIRERGGMKRAIADGYPQAEIEKASYRYQQEIDDGKRKIVGVNSYKIDEDLGGMKLLKVDPKLEEQQRERLKAFKAARDAAGVEAALGALQAAAADAKTNLFPLLVSAVEARATLGEIVSTLKAEFGSFSEGGAIG